MGPNPKKRETRRDRDKTQDNGSVGLTEVVRAADVLEEAAATSSSDREKPRVEERGNGAETTPRVMGITLEHANKFQLQRTICRVGLNGDTASILEVASRNFCAREQPRRDVQLFELLEKREMKRSFDETVI